MKIKILIMTLFAIFLFLFLSGCTSNNTDDNPSDGDNWLENYTPAHSVGTDSDDFWINNPSSGEIVEHIQWLTKPMENNSVLFVVHNTNCNTCQPQADRVIALAEKYGYNVTFFDLDIVRDDATYQRGLEVYLYDPDGGDKSIALTGVFTYVNDSGEVKIGWHSWESNTVETAEMESYIKDAIYYYQLNKGE